MGRAVALQSVIQFRYERYDKREVVQYDVLPVAQRSAAMLEAPHALAWDSTGCAAARKRCSVVVVVVEKREPLMLPLMLPLLPRVSLSGQASASSSSSSGLEYGHVACGEKERNGKVCSAEFLPFQENVIIVSSVVVSRVTGVSIGVRHGPVPVSYRAARYEARIWR